MLQTLILFAHGARDPAWAEPLQKLAQTLAARTPGQRVSLAFLELMTPALPDCIDQAVAQGSRRIVVIPAFMARGAHLRRDLPLLLQAARQRHQGVEIIQSAALGEAEPVITAMADWIAASYGQGGDGIDTA
ncbi:sirohydrochlorin chelatase [Chitinimonas lacunae]|uniref:Sirohydrochlorin chelatase n=1 Tax=Chitinimonas lacunae TaxID=1963018 RepID=A0ABV8MW57_9NEIS